MLKAASAEARAQRAIR